jgi:hypothetical protein
LDPALLLYRPDDWLQHAQHCDERMGALLEHRDNCVRFGGKIALTPEMQSLLVSNFPWDAQSRVPQVRDLIRVIMGDLQRAEFLTPAEADTTSVSVTGLCQHVDWEIVERPWKGLLGSLVSVEATVLVATWTKLNPAQLRVSTLTGSVRRSADLPIVWNDDGWAEQVDPMSAWPDLALCTRILVSSDAGWRTRSGSAVAKPLRYDDAFVREAELALPSDVDRRSFFKCLAKLAFNHRDGGLGDEAVRDFRRCRITRGRRLHYRETANVITLLSVGGHRLDGVD